MSVPELLHRIREKCLINLQRLGLFSVKQAPAPDLSVKVRPWLKSGTALPADCYLEEATRVLAGQVAIFGLRPASLGVVPLWNTDPKSGVHAPLIFGRMLDYRNAEVVGDIKYLWSLIGICSGLCWHRHMRCRESAGSLTVLPSSYRPGWNSAPILWDLTGRALWSWAFAS